MTITTTTTPMDQAAIQKMLARIRELLGEAEYVDSYLRWENRSRENPLALRGAVEDLEAKLREVHSRGAWLYKAYDNRCRMRHSHDAVSPGKRPNAMPMR